jgi:hypothetical protein
VVWIPPSRPRSCTAPWATSSPASSSTTALLRLHEREQVERTFRAHLGIDLVTVDDAPTGSSRRSSRGGSRGEAHDHRAHVHRRVRGTRPTVGGGVEYLVQGTLYPDVIESASPRGGPSVTIKTHHNVGGLPAGHAVQAHRAAARAVQGRGPHVGRELGLPEEMVGRHPFPGPGLAIRILGDVTPSRARRTPAPGRRHLPGGDSRGGTVRRHLAGVRRAAPRPQRRRHGGLSHLREHPRPARRNQRGWHDRRLVPSSRTTSLARISNRIINEVRA